MKEESQFVLSRDEQAFVTDKGGIPNVYMDGLVILCRRDGLTVDQALKKAIDMSKKGGGKEHIPSFQRAHSFLSANKGRFNLT